MKKVIKITAFTISLCIILLLSACSPVDKNYGVESDASTPQKLVKTADDSVSHPEIMSNDRIMSQFIDISLYDEENYAQIYLGKRFKFNISYAGNEFTVPTTLSTLKKQGWNMVENNQYHEDSLVYACDTVDAVFQNGSGIKVGGLFYNSSKSSKKLKNCQIVKFRIDNNFYTNPENYTKFSVNGINNRMAVTDVIDTLGTPSHFYRNSDKDYYLDYFISQKDRRNGITVYIDPTNDLVNAVEFSYYK